MSKEDWDVVARLDPLWGILAEPSKKFGKWDIDEFFLRGQNEVLDLMDCINRLGYPKNRDCALDFGCGVGRVTIPLSKYFHKCYGLDISEVMIEKAKTFSKEALQDSYLVYLNDTNLEQFSDRTFDLVYSMFVLQHISEQSVLKNYIREFVRVLKENGLLVFQVPNITSLFNRSQLGLKIYRTFAWAGLSKKTLYNRFGLLPVVMNYLDDEEVRALLSSQGAKLLDVRLAPSSLGVSSTTYYVTK